jgi:hypothetical protein
MSKITEIQNFEENFYHCGICNNHFGESDYKLNIHDTRYDACNHINLDRNELLKTFKSDAVDKICAMYEYLQNGEKRFRRYYLENKTQNDINFVLQYTHLLVDNKLDIYENNKLLLQISMINNIAMICYILPHGVYPKTIHKEFLYVKVGNDKNLCLIGPLDDYIYTLVMDQFEM